jgi:hypothetical protein
LIKAEWDKIKAEETGVAEQKLDVFPFSLGRISKNTNYLRAKITSFLFHCQN